VTIKDSENLNRARNGQDLYAPEHSEEIPHETILSVPICMDYVTFLRI
jgi:hypothetical protein